MRIGAAAQRGADGLPRADAAGAGHRPCWLAARLSNREIAEKLYLSEGSVKQYVNRIYAKLFIEGDTRTKRKRLVEMTQH